MIDNLRFIKIGDGTLILQAYDGHQWFTPPVFDVQELGDGAKMELFRALELPAETGEKHG
jgi:hypothetical protein